MWDKNTDELPSAGSACGSFFIFARLAFPPAYSYGTPYGVNGTARCLRYSRNTAHITVEASRYLPQPSSAHLQQRWPRASLAALRSNVLLTPAVAVLPSTCAPTPPRPTVLSDLRARRHAGYSTSGRKVYRRRGHRRVRLKCSVVDEARVGAKVRAPVEAQKNERYRVGLRTPTVEIPKF